MYDKTTILQNTFVLEEESAPMEGGSRNYSIFAEIQGKMALSVDLVMIMEQEKTRPHKLSILFPLTSPK